MPDPTPNRIQALTGPQFFDINGARLAVWERAGAEPPILFAHATGFHAHCWSQIIGRIPSRRSIAFDMRGHGASSRPEPPYEWHKFGEDTAGLARALDLRGATGVGHSMGGHSLVMAAALVPEAFAELILIDPVIMPAALYTGRPREPHFARKRRDRWKSPMPSVREPAPSRGPQPAFQRQRRFHAYIIGKITSPIILLRLK